MYYFTAWGAWQPETKVLAGLDLAAVREALFHDSLLAFVGLLAIFAFLGSWHRNSNLHVVFSLRVCLHVQISPSIRAQSHWIRAYTNNLILTSSSAKTLFPNNVTFTDIEGHNSTQNSSSLFT